MPERPQRFSEEELDHLERRHCPRCPYCLEPLPKRGKVRQRTYGGGLYYCCLRCKELHRSWEDESLEEYNTYYGERLEEGASLNAGLPAPPDLRAWFDFQY